MRFSIDGKAMEKLNVTALILLFIFHLLYAVSFFSRIRIPLHALQVNGISLFLMLNFIFINFPFKRGRVRKSIPWYDLVLILLIAVPTFYIVTAFNTYWMYIGSTRTLFEVVSGLVSVVLLLEACRRTAGWAMVWVSLVAIVYVAWGNFVPGFFNTAGIGIKGLSGGLWLSGDGIYGTPLGVIPDYIFALILFTSAFQSVGGGAFMQRLAFALFGRLRGRSAKIAVALNGMLGMISGSSIASVYLSGPTCIPEMRKEGYPESYSGGLIASAGTGSQIAPPVMGIVAFVMADLLGMPYIKLCIVAAIPAFLYFLALFMVVDLDSARLGMQRQPPSPEHLVPLKKIMAEGWVPILSMSLLVTLLVSQVVTVRLAATLSAAVAVVFGSLRKQNGIRLNQLKKIGRETAMGLAHIGPLSALAGVIVACVAMSSLDYKFTAELLSIAKTGNILPILILTAIASIILGMGLPTLPMYILLSLIVTPGLATIGMEPVVVHMFVFYLGLAAMVTPPVCLNVYAVYSMVRSSIWPIGLNALRLEAGTFIIPFMFAYHPGLLLKGSLPQIIASLFIAVVGIVALSVGRARYGLRPTNIGETAAILIGGLFFVFPVFQNSKLIGAILLAGATVSQVIKYIKYKPGDDPVKIADLRRTEI